MSTGLSRRGLLQTSGAAFVASVIGACDRGTKASAGANASADPITLPGWLAPTESEKNQMPAPWPVEKRVGVAIVGLGRLSLEEILPGFGMSAKCKPVALVSGNRDKANTVAAQYGIKPEHLYDYAGFDKIKNDPAIEVVYIVLPNSMHAEYTVRAAQAGKHVLSEKPMANSVAECQQMIDACAKANKKLMVAYRMQYEPFNREAIRLARSGELGALKQFIASNGQAQGDPNQWRLKKALAGGGPMPDVGIYCLNAARYLSGEEPIEIQAQQFTTPNDPRFKEVEEQITFQMRFPSGFMAQCASSYSIHESRMYRLMGEKAWVELDPAFPYRGQTMRIGHKEGVEQRQIQAKNQFALEMDHMAECVRNDIKPHTPGEEGMQDMKLVASIYEAAAGGGTVKLAPVAERDAFRGPAPT